MLNIERTFVKSNILYFVYGIHPHGERGEMLWNTYAFTHVEAAHAYVDFLNTHYDDPSVPFPGTSTLVEIMDDHTQTSERFEIHAPAVKVSVDPSTEYSIYALFSPPMDTGEEMYIHASTVRGLSPLHAFQQYVDRLELSTPKYMKPGERQEFKVMDNENKNTYFQLRGRTSVTLEESPRTGDIYASSKKRTQ